ncbi:MAG TPA: hypothetical protein VF210_21860 [Pseudomonadales bacterium]
MPTMLLGGAALLVAAFGGTPLSAAEPLRVCADPNNLPFSNRAGEGFENALAERLAEWSGRGGVDDHWWPQRRGFLRNTLNAGRCDLIMGVPAGYPPVWPTRPDYRSSYVFVYRADADWDFDSIDDPRLAGLSIGVPVVGDDYAITPGRGPRPARTRRQRHRVQRLRRLRAVTSRSTANWSAC